MNNTLLALIGIALVLGPGVGHAADRKVYPGSKCRSVQETAESITYGALFNASNQRLKVSCPVIRDKTRRGIKSGRVTLVDQSFAQDVECQLRRSYLYYSKSTATYTDYPNNQKIESEGISTSPKTYEFGGHGQLASDAFHLHMLCELPPSESGRRSGIVSYSVLEW